MLNAIKKISLPSVSRLADLNVAAFVVVTVAYRLWGQSDEFYFHQAYFHINMQNKLENTSLRWPEKNERRAVETAGGGLELTRGFSESMTYLFQRTACCCA